MVQHSADSPVTKVALRGLSGKLQHPEQGRAWAASGQTHLATVPWRTEAQHSAFSGPLGPGSASSVSPVAPDPHPVPQFKAILTSPTILPAVGQTQLPLLLQSLPGHLKVFGFLALHLTLPSRGMYFQETYSKPPSLKYIVNPARKLKALTRALCRPIPPVSYFLLTKIFPCYFISKRALMIRKSLDSTLNRGHGKYDLVLPLL